jgi:hypothetical protein
MTKPLSFLRIWLTSLIGFAVLVVLVNLFVNPYDVFDTPRIAGISALKPDARDHLMLAKTYQLARSHPVTVVIGSSVVYLGIDAFAPAWPAAMTPVYNYGIPGTAIATSLRILEEAVYASGAKNAVVFLDFQNFFAPPSHATALTEDERRFRFTPDGAPNPYRRRQVADDMFLSLATRSALIDSVTTVASQGRPNVLNLAPDGSSTEADFLNAARADGMHDLFSQKNILESEQATRLARRMAAWNGPLPNLDIVAAMIGFTRAHGVKLTLAIAPHHIDALELYARNGLWPRVEQLKTELAALVASQGNGVTLWDFMDYSSFSEENVPLAGDRQTPTHWFWESAHFKKQLGEVMIRCMFGGSVPVFGVVLTPENVAARNVEIRAQRQAAVCGPNPPLLTGIDSPLDDGCARRALFPRQHGPT